MSYYDLKVGSNFGLVDEVLKWDRSMLFKVVATFEYVDEILTVNIQMKAAQLHFLVV